MLHVNLHFDTLRGPQGVWQWFLFFVYPTCPHLDRPVVLLQGQRGCLSSQPALDYSGEVEEMEEGDAEGEGPMAVREGPSGHGLPSDASNTTTTNLLASVKEQVGGRRCCSHTLLVHSLSLYLTHPEAAFTTHNLPAFFFLFSFWSSYFIFFWWMIVSTPGCNLQHDPYCT